jgi:hypothetical protein
MTTRPSHQTPGQWPATGTIPWSTAPDAATVATYIPPAAAARAAAQFDATAARQPYVSSFAWSSEAPEYVAPPVPERPRGRFSRSGIATLVGGSLVAAAAAAAAVGLFAALGGTATPQVDTTTRSAPAPTVAAAAPAPTAPATAAVTSRPVTSSRRSSGSSAHRSPSSAPSSSASAQKTDDGQWQSGHGNVSTPPNWNQDNSHWYTTWRDDSRWSRDHDGDDSHNSSDHDRSSRTTHDGDDGHSSSDPGHEGHDGTPSPGQSSDDHSDQNGHSK